MQVLFLQSHSTCFGPKRPSSGVFKTSTAATGTCVIVVGQSSHLKLVFHLTYTMMHGSTKLKSHICRSRVDFCTQIGYP